VASIHALKYRRTTMKKHRRTIQEKREDAAVATLGMETTESVEEEVINIFDDADDKIVNYYEYVDRVKRL
jgi:hypothetical protein